MRTALIEHVQAFSLLCQRPVRLHQQQRTLNLLICPVSQLTAPAARRYFSFGTALTVL